MTERERRKQERQDEEAEDGGDDWNTRHYFDMHDFCYPSKACIEGSQGGSIPGNPEAYLPLGRFINQLPGLQDLVWAYGSHMPLSVLSAVSAQGCRLHMHRFCLGSLVQLNNSPQPIDMDDYALATLSCLSSIAVQVGDFHSDGKVDYTEEAVMRMVAGTAPSLSTCLSYSGGAWCFTRRRGGRSSWKACLGLILLPWDVRSRATHTRQSSESRLS